MRTVKDRKEFYSLITSVVQSNRDYFSQFGNWKMPQLKVFWLEVNRKSMQSYPVEMKNIDKNLFEIQYKKARYWIDTSDDRIWEILTFSSTNETHTMINNLFTKKKGFDRLWFTDKFMNSIQKMLGYDHRGFGIRYSDILSEERDQSYFSAKFWVGKNTSKNQHEFLTKAKSSFSMSNIRFGKWDENRQQKLSSELYELYYNGHITINTSDDIETVFHVVSTIEKQYKSNLHFLENESIKKPLVVEVTYKDNVNIEGFNIITSYGIGKLKLWLQQYDSEDGMNRYSGVDLHTGDFIYLDMTDNYSYLSPEKKACMNVAPRFGTLSSRYLSTSSELYYDGVELFG